VGYRKHQKLKCHTCKSQKSLGGTKKMGSLSATGDWKMVQLNGEQWVWYCPSCVRKHVGQK
jgi:hypothetical protein